MKRCPECRRDYYDETLLYCLDDGAALVDGPASGDDPATVRLRSPESLRGKVETEADTRLYTSGDAISREIRRHKFGVVAIAGLVVVLIAGFAYGLYRFLDKQTPSRSSANMQTQRLTGDGKARGVEISPDGKFLAYIRVDGSERSIWLKQVQTNIDIAIVKPGDLDRFNGLAFSPDGNFLYFNAQSNTGDTVPGIFRVATLGGTPTRVFSKSYQIQFSPDGKQVSFGRFDLAANESSIVIANADGSSERKLATRSGTKFFDPTQAWSPDGRWIAVAAGDDAIAPDPPLSVVMLSLADGSERAVGDAWAHIDDIVWHPSGDSLIVVGADIPTVQTQLWEVDYPTGARRRITNNMNGHGSVSITADGKFIVTGEIYARTAVWVSPDAKAENAKPVMPATGDTWGLSWTHDGRIVYVSDQTGDSEVWIMDADGKNATALTNDRVYKSVPVASSDGKYIVYSAATGLGQLVRLGIGGGVTPFVFANIFGPDNPDISPDSKWVLFSGWTSGRQRIFRTPLDGGGEPQQLTDFSATEPRYSNDGTMFACFVQSEQTNQFDRLAIVASEGGAPLTVLPIPGNTHISRGPIWAPDDKGITLIVSPGELQNLWLQPIDGSPGKALTNFELPGVARRAYSRDGKRIAIVRGEGFGNAVMITDYR